MTLPSDVARAPAPDVKCPHCGALARIEPSASLRWRCGVCGGPVVPGDAPRSSAELPDLVRSHRVRAMALGWLGASFVLFAIAAMATGVALLLWLASHLAGVILAVVAAVAGVLALGSLRRSRRQRDEAREQLDQAWESVAREVLAHRHGDMTAEELARMMRTDTGHAERLLSRLSVEGRVRVAVRDDAELTYRAGEDGVEDALAPAGEPPVQVRTR